MGRVSWRGGSDQSIWPSLGGMDAAGTEVESVLGTEPQVPSADGVSSVTLSERPPLKLPHLTCLSAERTPAVLVVTIVPGNPGNVGLRGPIVLLGFLAPQVVSAEPLQGEEGGRQAR